MNRLWKIFSTFFEMNFKEFKRDRVSAFFTLVFPLFFVLVFGISTSYRSSIKFALGVSDLENSTQSKRLVSAISSRPFVSVQHVSPQNGKAELAQNKLGALLVIPHASPGKDASPLPELYASPGQRELSKTILDASLNSLEPGYKDVRRYQVLETPLRKMNDFTYIFPGLLAMALLQLGLFATATPLLRTRDRGTLKHLSLTPAPIGLILCSQVLVRFVVALVQIALLLTAGHYLFQVQFAGNALLLLLALSLGSVMLIAAGYAIAGWAPSQETGMLVIMLANFAMLFFGQIFFDFSGIAGLRQLTKLMPVTYLADACRQSLLGVPGMFSISFDLLMITVWVFIAGFVAVRTFRFDMEAR